MGRLTLLRQIEQSKHPSQTRTCSHPCIGVLGQGSSGWPGEEPLGFQSPSEAVPKEDRQVCRAGLPLRVHSDFRLKVSNLIFVTGYAQHPYLHSLSYQKSHLMAASPPGSISAS